MTGKRWIALAAAAVLLLVSSLFTTITQDFAVDEFVGMDEPGVAEEVVEPGTDPGKIAVIHIDGVMQDTGEDDLLGTVGYNHQEILNQLDQAAQDGEVEGVVLRVNSPGGGVVESDEVHDRVEGIQEDYGKPVYVSMGAQAASGGYYVAAPAEEIYANGQTITGSLGVIMQSYDVTELADDIGVEAESFTSGEHIDFLSPLSETDDGEREIVDELVDDAYEQFVDVIEEGRDLSRDDVYDLADGRIYTGNQAEDNELIDETGHLEDATAGLMEELDMGDLSVVEYGGGTGIPSLFGMASEVFPGAEQRQMEEILDNTHGPELMYLYTE